MTANYLLMVIILTLDSICRPSLLSHIVTFQFIQHVKWFVCGRNFLLKTFDWNYAFSCNYIYAIFSIGTNTLLFSMFPVLWPNQFIIVQGRGQKKLGPTVMEDLTVRVLTPSLERPRAFSSNPWRWCCVSWAASRRHAAWHACVCVTQCFVLSILSSPTSSRMLLVQPVQATEVLTIKDLCHSSPRV